MVMNSYISIFLLIITNNLHYKKNSKQTFKNSNRKKNYHKLNLDWH